MLTLLLTFLFFVFIVLAMSIGVIYGRKPISGSCGGLNASGVCELCGGLPENCDSSSEGQKANGRENSATHTRAGNAAPVQGGNWYNAGSGENPGRPD